MKLKFVLMAFAVTLMTAQAPCRAQESESAKKVNIAAIKTVVDKWLAYIDAEDYSESWKKSSELFRAKVTEDAWKDQISKSRKPLGKLIKRELRLKQIESSLPGAPDGNYVIFQFISTFENKKDATETVTPHLDKDKHWRVSGYFIK